MVKTCSKCGEEKDISEFYAHKAAKDGKRPDCRTCVRARNDRWTEANRERYLDYQRTYAEQNAEARRAQKAAYYQKNRSKLIAAAVAYQRQHPEKNAAAVERYRERNPDKIKESRRRSRARPGYRQAEKAARRAGEPTTPEAREYITILARDPCSYCGNPCEQVDHIVPIADDGDGQWGNLTAACARCNVRKGRMPLLGFLLR